MSIGKSFAAYNSDLVQIKPSGNDRVNLLFKGFEVANSMVESGIQNVDPNWIAFIPNHKVSTSGLVRGVDPELSTQDILEGLRVFSPEIEVIQIERITKNPSSVDLQSSPSKKVERIPTTSVKIYFDGDTLPKWISIWFLRRNVSPFIPTTKICFECFIFGHVKDQCRSRGFRYTKCSGNHNFPECTENNFFCRNCLGNHSLLFKQCPAFLFHKKVNEYRFLNNISFEDARKHVRGSENAKLGYQSSFHLLSANTGQSPICCSKNLSGVYLHNLYERTSASRRGTNPKSEKNLFNKTFFSKKLLDFEQYNYP